MIQLVKAFVDFPFEIFGFDFQKRHVVLLRGNDEGRTAVFGDGDRSHPGGVQNVSELLFSVVGGESDHKIAVSSILDEMDEFAMLEFGKRFVVSVL